MTQKNEDDLRAARERAGRDTLEYINNMRPAPLHRAEPKPAEVNEDQSK